MSSATKDATLGGVASAQQTSTDSQSTVTAGNGSQRGPFAAPAPSTTASKKCTDIGNGERLADWGRDGLRYLHGIGWLLWDGKRWVRDEGDILIEGLAKRAVRGI